MALLAHTHTCSLKTQATLIYVFLLLIVTHLTEVFCVCTHNDVVSGLIVIDCLMNTLYLQFLQFINCHVSIYKYGLLTLTHTQTGSKRTRIKKTLTKYEEKTRKKE